MIQCSEGYFSVWGFRISDGYCGIATHKGATYAYDGKAGADPVLKKLGSIGDNISIVASYGAASGTDIVLKGTYTAIEDMTVLASYFLDDSGNTQPVTNGTALFHSGKIAATGSYYYGLSIISLKKDNYVKLYSRQNGEGCIIRLT